MDPKKNQKKPLTKRDKLRIAWAPALFAAIGAALGMIAYLNSWLG